MSLKETSTSSPMMMKLRTKLAIINSVHGPVAVAEIAKMAGMHPPTVYGYMLKLEADGLAHIAAWRLVDIGSRFQEIPEWMSGPGMRAPQSVRSARELDARKSVVIETKIKKVLPIPFDHLLVALGGIKQQGASV